MFWQKQQTSLSIACTYNANHYSLAILENNAKVIFHRFLPIQSNMLMAMQELGKEIEHLDLIAHDCSLILLPGQYQLLLMDVMQVPEAEMAKALRWNLKGLSEYDLEDVAIDTFPMPIIESDGKKKMLVALTSLSKLNEKRTLFESAFLNITRVSIIEIGLKNLLAIICNKQGQLANSPSIIMSTYNSMRKLCIVYQNMFYLIRELAVNKADTGQEATNWDNIQYEIERSIAYFVNQQNFPEPKHLFFVPGFHHDIAFLEVIGKKLSLTVELIDINHYLNIQPPINIEQQHDVFYSITGALSDSPIELPK